MKKFLFLLLFLPSCQKEYCWECEFTTCHRDIVLGTNGCTTSQIGYCDKTEKEINQIILEHEHTTGMSSYSHMTCTKKQ